MKNVVNYFLYVSLNVLALLAFWLISSLLLCTVCIVDLKIRTDDAYLLRFLRAKKFDYDRAFNLVIRHFEMKADEKNKQLFHNLRPMGVKHVLEAGVTGVLPNRDKFGRRVIVFRPGNVLNL